MGAASSSSTAAAAAAAAPSSSPKPSPIEKGKEKDMRGWNADLAIEALSTSFTQMASSTHRTTYVYLLADERVWNDIRARANDEDAVWDQTAIRHALEASIFYVGIGTDRRLENYFHDALDLSASEHYHQKLQRIRDIWEHGKRVIPLRIWDHLDDDEAHAREALLISYLCATGKHMWGHGAGMHICGHQNDRRHVCLCNNINGTFAGPTAHMSPRERCALGEELMKQATFVWMGNDCALHGIRRGDIV